VIFGGSNHAISRSRREGRTSKSIESDEPRECQEIPMRSLRNSAFSA